MDKQFELDNVICHMGKIANNLEKHGEDDVTEFNIPIRDVMLTEEQLNALSADPYAFRSWYHINGQCQEPMPWTAAYVPFKHDTKFAEATAVIRLQSDEEFEFDNCRMKDIELTPQVGGLTKCEFTLQLCPGLDRVNLLLQEYQNREIRLTVMDAKVALKKKSKQKELPLQQPPDEERELARSSEAELEAARQRDEAERQLSEALRGLDAQQQPDRVDGGDAANDGEESGDESSDEAA